MRFLRPWVFGPLWSDLCTLKRPNLPLSILFQLLQSWNCKTRCETAKKTMRNCKKHNFQPFLKGRYHLWIEWPLLFSFPAIVFVYDFHSGAETLMHRHFTQQGRMNGFNAPFMALDRSTRQFPKSKIGEYHLSGYKHMFLWHHSRFVSSYFLHNTIYL